jgi:hypothetical protein
MALASVLDASELIKGLIGLMDAVVSSDERARFFTETLPFIVDCARAAPVLLRTCDGGPIPSLVPDPPSATNRSVDLPRSAVAGLLALSFFGLFDSDACGAALSKRSNSTALWLTTTRHAQEKMRLILVYWQYLSTRHAALSAEAKSGASAGAGAGAAVDSSAVPVLYFDDRVIRVHRRSVSTGPGAVESKAGGRISASALASESAVLPAVSLMGDGETIEAAPAHTHLHVVFANKAVGGLWGGAASEEIRFATHTEALAAQIVCGAVEMGRGESVAVIGAEAISVSSGYNATLKCEGLVRSLLTTKPPAASSPATATAADAKSSAAAAAAAPVSAVRVRGPALTAIDAESGIQFTVPAMLRELVKAYSGFSTPHAVLNAGSQHTFGAADTAVATGNWCGALALCHHSPHH